MAPLHKKQNSRTAWRLLILTVFVILATLLFQRPINHDAGWYLYATGAFLDGAEIYHDLIDINPPLIFWLNVPPVWLARLLNCSAVPLFNFFFLFIVILSLTLSTHILKKVLLHLPRPSQYCFLVVLVFLFIPYEMPWNCFGQREHLMFVLVMPYVFASTARLMGHPLQIKLAATLGLLAGIGFAFKPHFLLAYFCIETYLLVAHKSYKFWRRPESIGIFLCQALYWGYILLAVPEYKEAVLMILPIYSTFTDPMPLRFLAAYSALFGSAVISFLILRSNKLGQLLFIAFSAFFIIALVQNKGWHYHLYPASSSAAMLIAFAILNLYQKFRKSKKLLAATRCAIVLMFLFLIFLKTMPFIKPFSIITYPFREPLNQLIPIVKQHAYGKPIYVFSSSLTPAFPLVNYAQTSWSSRFNCLWFLPSFYTDVTSTAQAFPYHEFAEMDMFERSFLEKVISDVIKASPAIVIFDCAPWLQGFGKTNFQYLEYFSQEPRFASFWKDYVFLTSVDTYKVFKRNPGQQP